MLFVNPRAMARPRLPFKSPRISLELTNQPSKLASRRGSHPTVLPWLGWLSMSALFTIEWCVIQMAAPHSRLSMASDGRARWSNLESRFSIRAEATQIQVKSEVAA